MYNPVGIQVGFGIATTLSTVGELFLIVSHITVPKLLKHPGSLILGQCAAHIFIDFHSYTSITSFRDSAIRAGVCTPIGWVTFLCYIICWNYMTCLSLEIMLKITQPSNTRCERRVYIQHVGSWAFAGVLAATSYAFIESDKLNQGTCFMEFDSKGE
jgi:hypothetical protein